MADDLSTIGKKARQRRLEQGLSQTQAASQVLAHRNDISEIENGRFTGSVSTDYLAGNEPSGAKDSLDPRVTAYLLVSGFWKPPAPVMDLAFPLINLTWNFTDAYRKLIPP